MTDMPIDNDSTELLALDQELHPMTKSLDGVSPVYLYIAGQKSKQSRTMVRSRLKGIALLYGEIELDKVPWTKMTHKDALYIAHELSRPFYDEDGTRFERRPTTIRGYMDAFRGACKQYWLANELSHENYLKIKEVKIKIGKRVKTFERYDKQTVLSWCQALDDNTFKGTRDATMIALLYGSGIRRAELAHLKIENIFFQKKRLRVLGKGDKERVVPVIPWAFEYLVRWIEEKRGDNDGYVFSKIEQNETTYDDKPLSPGSVSYLLTNAFKKLNLVNPPSPHAFRHNFATKVKETSNNDIKMVQKLLGHEHLSTTLGYFIDNIDEAEDVVMNMD